MTREDQERIERLGADPILRNPELVDAFITDVRALERTRKNWNVLVENIIRNQPREMWVNTLVERLMMAYLLGCKRGGALPGGIRSIPVRDLIRSIRESKGWLRPREAWAATLEEVFDVWPSAIVIPTVVDMLVEAYVTGCQRRPDS